MITELNPCPFCGVSPVLLCDLTDWKGTPIYGKPNANHHVTYELYANHKHGCYITYINGTNSTGKSTALNWECLVEAWNKRPIEDDLKEKASDLQTCLDEAEGRIPNW